MKSVRPVITLLSLLLVTLALASASEKTTQNPADNLNQADETKQIEDKTEKVIPETSRGQLLYEHHCLKCHESNIHIRNKRKAKNIEDVQVWVVKWQAYEKLNWDRNAIDAVTEHLVKRYYKFK